MDQSVVAPYPEVSVFVTRNGIDDRIVEARKIASCSIVELKKYMDEINVDYVLMTAERFDELDNSDLYDAVVRNEDFAVYRKSNRAGTN